MELGWGREAVSLLGSIIVLIPEWKGLIYQDKGYSE